MAAPQAAPSLSDDIAVGLNMLKYLQPIVRMIKAIQASNDIQDGFTAIEHVIKDYQTMTGSEQRPIEKMSRVELHETLQGIQKHLDGMSPEGSGNPSI